MDYEKYYDIKNDLYVIHFANNDGISTKELKEMFSAYGKVSINIRHQFGLCFVGYQNVEDTIKCLNAFKNHKSIKILKHKNKIGNSSKDKNTTNKNQNFPAKKSVSLSNITESSNKVQNEKQFGSNSLVSKRDNDFERSICSYSISSDLSDKDEIPSLTYNNNMKIVQAEEVIVANIHPSSELQEILSLFKDFYPICASFIQQVPHTEIRYCHAYFSSASHALAVEKKFDKYLLHDNTLIVLRSQMLIEEALFK